MAYIVRTPVTAHVYTLTCRSSKIEAIVSLCTVSREIHNKSRRKKKKKTNDKKEILKRKKGVSQKKE